MLVLAMDVGTQSVRSLLIDPEGEIKAKVKRAIEPYFSRKPGWAEQYADYYWDQLCECTRQLLVENASVKSEIKAVTLTTQRATVIPVDGNGKPLRPAILWLDQRKAQLGDFPKGWMKWSMKAANVYPLVKHAILESEANWLAQNEPSLWAQTDKLLFLSAYLHGQLCGHQVDSVGNMVGYVPFDHKKQQWAAQGDFKWKIFGIQPEQLPELYPPGTEIGQITAIAAEESGLPQGLPLYTAAADKACEVLGAGCASPGTACLSYGTTATANTTIPAYTEVIPFMPAYPSAVPQRFNTEVMIFRGYWMVSWFKQQFAQKEIELAEATGQAVEELLEEQIRDVPPGSMGLTLQPFWSPGVKFPGPEAKGAIIGFGDVHTKAHVYKAILEGLAYGLKEGLERTRKKTGYPVQQLMVAGGGSQSEQAMQITADIFGLPAKRPHTFETSALGAAMCAFVGMGVHADFDAAIEAMCREKDQFDPIPEHRQVYQELYNKVYRKMYRRLQPLYQAIQAITGYPA